MGKDFGPREKPNQSRKDFFLSWHKKEETYSKTVDGIIAFDRVKICFFFFFMISKSKYCSCFKSECRTLMISRLIVFQALWIFI